jgi:hypothetical protein
MKAMRISIRALMHILEPNLEACNCLGNRLHLYCFTRLHATNLVIACSLIYNRNLAYGERIRLDYCNVISATCELGMAIITLGMIYFVVSYRLAPTDAAPLQQGGHCVATRVPSEAPF